MATIQQCHNKFRAKLRIPKPLRDRHEDREFLYRTLSSLDPRSAQVEADAWEAGIRAEWLSIQAKGRTSRPNLRIIYEEGRKAALAGEYLVEMDGEDDPTEVGIEFEIDQLADEVGEQDLSEAQQARIASLQDLSKNTEGKTPAPRPEIELSVTEIAKEHQDLWPPKEG